ncbi:hypothetical protein [Brevundimonas subvibrioides]|uniref:hypothetical protein n=1 Tax=Brevundimonas subvibrioides TaxID=74313 RepID=UPI0022B2EE05|nr:hypothetical protein [Brevundimonas subvibrioides]
MTLALPGIVGCSAAKPEWTVAEGWLSARCEAASELLLQRGDGSIRTRFETWRGLTDAFAASTDARMELQQRARASMAGNGTAEAFFAANCGDDAVADVRRTL